MNIAIYGRTDRGGLKTHVLTLVNQLSKRHKVQLVSQDTLGSFSIYSGLYFFDFKNHSSFFKNLMDSSDILHIHHPSTSFEFSVPKIKSSTPIVNTFHLSLGTIFNNLKARMLNQTNIIVINRLAKVYAKRSYRYIAVGRALSKILDKYNKTSIINNAVDTNLFRPFKSERYFKDFTIGYIGRLDPEKNVENLIRACNELEINIAIAGDSRDLEKYKRDFECKSVKFLGLIEHSLTPEFYNKIDLFVSPSLMEASPITTIEAMSCGKPIISGNFGGEEKNIKETFGLISKPDKKSIKLSIMKIRKMNIKNMGINARKEVTQKYNLKDMIKKIELIYEEAIRHN